MRHIVGGYCTNEGYDLCESCMDSSGNECEECGQMMCSECARDSQYHTGDRLCNECLPEEYQAESFSAEDGWEVLTCPSCIAPLGASSYNTHENTNIHCMKCMEQFDELKSIPLYHKGKKMRAESFSADSKCDHSNLIGDVSEVLSWAEYRCLDCGATQYHEFPEMNYENVEALELIDTDHKIRSDFYARLERDYPLPEDWEAESHAYSYAYNEGHSDSRKTGEYRPSLSTPKQEAAFKRILKQKAEEDEEFPHTKQFLCGLEGHKWKMKPLKKTCKKCGLVIKNRLRGHR